MLGLHSSLLVILCVIVVYGAGCRRQDRQEDPTLPPLTAAAIRSASDDMVEEMIIDHLFALIGNDYDSEYRIITGLTPGFQMVYATWWLEAEVNNGGFNQYFWNSSGQFANEALDGFRLIGATKHAHLMQRAIATFIKEEPTMKQFRIRNDLKAFAESYQHTGLNALDEEYYQLEEDLQALRVIFIREHLEQFTGH